MALTPRTTAVARPTLAVAAAFLLFASVGCTAGATDSTPADADSGVSAENDDATGGDSGADAGGNADVGTITVESTTYTVLEAVNCELVQSTDLVTRVFDALAVAQSPDGGDALFFVYVEEQAGQFSNFIDYQGPEGTWSSNPGVATLTLSDDNQLTGSSVLVDDGDTESIMIEFNFTVPDELVEC